MKSYSLQYFSFGTSSIILILTFIQPFRPIDIISSILHFFDIYMSFSISVIEQFLISSVPILVYYLNKKNGSLELKTISIQIIIIYLFLLILFMVSVYFIVVFSNVKTPLIPENYIREPFELYFTLIVFLGILIPFKIIDNKLKSK